MALELMDRITRAEYERELDVALAGSFPASDPLPWTLGVAIEPEPVRPDPARFRATVVDVVVDPGTVFGYRRLASVAEALALTMLVPIGILLIGIPIVAAVRAAVWVVLRVNQP